MSWGDAWGDAPWDYHKRLAKAFHEGREAYGSRSTFVKFATNSHVLGYWYNGAVIARWFCEESRARAIAEKLLTGRCPLWSGIDAEGPEFRCHFRDKGEAWHLQALGLQAKWQWGKRPFLIEGVDACSGNWYTKEEWQMADKWVEPPKAPRAPRTPRDPFVNLTLPLPGFA